MDKTESIINNIFQSLKAIYPANGYAWDNQEVMNNAKHQWLLAFKESNLQDIELIKNGLAKCRASGDSFIPSIGQFIKLCGTEPMKLGAPSYHQAFEEAKSKAHPPSDGKPWSHPAVYHAYMETGAVKVLGCMRLSQEQSIKKIFDSNYNMALRMLSNGEELRELPKLIDKPKFAKEITKTGRAALDALRNL